MKKYSKFNEVKFKHIHPAGWLKKTLEKELCGMVGNLHEIGYPFNTHCWQYKNTPCNSIEPWWPYEQEAYRIDALVRCSVLLDRFDELEKVIGEDIEKSLETDSFIGPEELKEDVEHYRWPIAVFGRALYALWSKTGNLEYLEKLKNHYLGDDNTYHKQRDVVNAETMLRVYEQLGNEKLLEKAKKAFKCYNEYERSRETVENLANTMVYDHGVTFNEITKISVIMYIYTGEKRYLNAAIKAYEQIEKFHMLPDGVHSSRENLTGNDTMKLHESCDISDFTWSMGYLLEATGNAKYADRIEKAIFNAFFGATAPDFMAAQYYSGVNQVIATRSSIHDRAYLDTPRMQYAPHHYPECCVANIGRAVPNYVLRMYQLAQNALVLSLYGDSTYDDENISVIQTGNYPYKYKTNLDVKLKNSSIKALKLRIPSWSYGFEVYVNGKETDYEEINGYACFNINCDCKIEVCFSPKFEINTSSDGGIYYNYGPFLLSLKIKEVCTIDEKEKRQTKAFPAYEKIPASPWNYAVSGWEKPEIVVNEEKDEPLWNFLPFEIKIKAHKLKGWELLECEGEMRKIILGDAAMNEKHEKLFGATIITETGNYMPGLPTLEYVEKNLGEEEEITLIPYGCTNLRVTVFPKREIPEYYS